MGKLYVRGYLGTTGLPVEVFHMNIFVGNLLFDATAGDVKKLFEGFGNVASAMIVMEREKKAPKSRGFGFVQMPDEQQALAAIAALNGKELMGRVLNVNPARPKPAVEQDKGEAKKIRSEIKVKGQEYPKEEGDQKGPWYNPVFNKKRGRYKTGRRSRSFMKRRAASGIVEETMPKRESRENPMRWRKRKDQPKPWQKSPDEHKPWEKAEGEHKPWRKSEGASKPWKKTESESRPWKRSEKRFKPWEKARGEAKPWKKPAGETKPWSKSSERPQESRFNPSTSSFDKLRTNPERAKRVEGSLGMVRGNGERSRTKGPRKPGSHKR